MSKTRAPTHAEDAVDRAAGGVAVDGQAAGVARQVDPAARTCRPRLGPISRSTDGRVAHAEAVDGGADRAGAGGADLQGERQVAGEFGVGAVHADAGEDAADARGPPRARAEVPWSVILARPSSDVDPGHAADEDEADRVQRRRRRSRATWPSGEPVMRSSAPGITPFIRSSEPTPSTGTAYGGDVDLGRAWVRTSRRVSLRSSSVSVRLRSELTTVPPARLDSTRVVTRTTRAVRN